MARENKTWVFWLGLLIFAGACYEIFYTVWAYSYYYNNINIDFARFMVPPIVGGAIFILVGLYMMMAGRKETIGQTSTKPT